MIAAVEALDEGAFERKADDEGDRHAAKQRDEEAAGLEREPVRHVSAEHVEGAVREIDHAKDAEDQRQPARDQEQHEAVLHAVEHLNGEGGEVHEGSVVPRLAEREEGGERMRAG